MFCIYICIYIFMYFTYMYVYVKRQSYCLAVDKFLYWYISARHKTTVFRVMKMTKITWSSAHIIYFFFFFAVCTWMCITFLYICIYVIILQISCINMVRRKTKKKGIHIYNIHGFNKLYNIYAFEEISITQWLHLSACTYIFFYSLYIIIDMCLC